MKVQYQEMLQEALRAERNMQNLYALFKEHFKDDADFWEEIKNEEKQHESIVNLAKDVLTPDLMSEMFLFDNFEKLRETNNMVEDYIQNFENNTPSKEEAYNLAIRLEKGEYELFYQEAMSKKVALDQMEIFQKLNNGCVDHAKKIEELLRSN